MSWFQRRAEKPKGMYKASTPDYACINCAYHEEGTCHLHKKFIDRPSDVKCGDFLRQDHSVVTEHE